MLFFIAKEFEEKKKEEKKINASTAGPRRPVQILYTRSAAAPVRPAEIAATGAWSPDATRARTARARNRVTMFICRFRTKRVHIVGILYAVRKTRSTNDGRPTFEPCERDPRAPRTSHCYVNFFKRFISGEKNNRKNYEAEPRRLRRVPAERFPEKK